MRRLVFATTILLFLVGSADACPDFSSVEYKTLAKSHTNLLITLAIANILPAIFVSRVFWLVVAVTPVILLRAGLKNLCNTDIGRLESAIHQSNWEFAYAMSFITALVLVRYALKRWRNT